MVVLCSFTQERPIGQPNFELRDDLIRYAPASKTVEHFIVLVGCQKTESKAFKARCLGLESP